MTSGLPFTLERLHHVQLAIPVGGEEESRKFWGGILGMTEHPKPPALAARGGCWFRSEGLEIHLGVETDFVPAQKAHPAIIVKNLTAFANHLEANGVTVTWDEEFPGYRRFYANDPFGNRLELLEAQ